MNIALGLLIFAGFAGSIRLAINSMRIRQDGWATAFICAAIVAAVVSGNLLTGVE